MNVTFDTRDAATTLDLPVSTGQGTAANNVGIRFQQPAQPLKRPVQTPQTMQTSQRPMQTPQTMQRSNPSNPPPPSREVAHTFSEFANPSKQRAPASTQSNQSYDDEVDDDMDNGSAGNVSEEDQDEREVEDEDLVGDYPARAEDTTETYRDVAEDPLRPSAGFRSIDEEKTDILCKLNRLKRQGMGNLRTFGIHSDIREMRAELNRVKSELDMDASVKFQRKILMALTSSMEFLNKRYDPFDLQLDGWSEQVCEDITSYDRIFERLHEKYKSKISAPPEVELLLAISSSAFVFHLTNSMFKNKSITENPQFMQQMAQAMAQQAQKQADKQAEVAQEEQQPAAPAPDPLPPPVSGRREIKGPGMDISSFLGGAGGMMSGMSGMSGLSGMPPMPMPGMPMMPPITAGPPPPQVSVRRPNNTASRPNNPKRPLPPPPPPASDSGSDRLSDIISEDLASVPDDLSSYGGSDAEDRRVISIPQPARKKAKPSTKNTKKIVML